MNLFITVIPTKGISRGLLRKNIRSLAGKPLIAYSILDAQEAKLVDRLYVTTDNAEIAQVSLKIY